MKTLFGHILRIDRTPGDLVFAIAFVILAVALAAALPWQAPFVARTPLIAQPAFWPLIGVSMMVVFGLIHLAAAVRSPRQPGRWAEVWLWARSAEFVGWFLAYVLVIPVIGYLPASMLFVPLLSLRLGYRSATMLGIGAFFGMAVVLIFKTGLGVALPAGQLYAFLPEAIRSFVMVNF